MRRTIQAAGGILVHLVFLILLAIVMTGPRSVRPPDPVDAPLIWTATASLPGEARGGGQGGNRAQASPAAIQRLRPDSTPVYVLPRMPDVLAALELPGLPVAFAAPSATGPGTDTGASGGKGEGSDGPGSGVGDGPGAGAGDRPFVDGSPGLVSPQLIFEKPPEYTVEAMAARAHGTVLLEAIVLEDGSVGAARVIRSMEPSFGLEHKAIEAVRAWRFRPGRYQGRVVQVKVLVELQFTLR